MTTDSSAALAQIQCRGGKELLARLPSNVLTALRNRAEAVGQASTTLDRDRVHTQLVGSNALALEAARQTALLELGFEEALVLSATLEGPAERIGHRLALLGVLAATLAADQHDAAARVALELVSRCGSNEDEVEAVRMAVARLDRLSGRLCLLLGGESTVHVPVGGGQGGRALHTALAAAVCLDSDKTPPVNGCLRVLVLGSDGADAATGMAGAVVWPGLINNSADQGSLLATTALSNCDSLSFFQQTGRERCLLQTGLTGTNVMDIMVVTLELGAARLDSQS